MVNETVFKRRSVKLLWLFIAMCVLIAVFLGSVARTIAAPRKLPSHTAVIHDRALRGAVISKDGYTLSRSNKSYEASVYAPCIVPGKKDLFIRLFSIYSGIDEETIRKTFYDKKGHPRKGNVILAKTIDAAHAIYLKELAYKLRRMGVFRSVPDKRGVPVLRGLDILENGEVREFPLGDTLTPVLGYVRTANQGRYRKVHGVKGLEKRYDKYLNDTRDGLIRGKRDVYGTVIRTKSTIRIPRKDGYSIVLNISINLQKRIEAVLDRMKRQTDAEEIIAGVIESQTGRILALASTERYDPLHITRADISKLNAKFTEYPYEPGSVLKPLTLSIALELGRVSPHTVFPTYNGKYKLSKRFTISDDEPFPSLDATDIIVHSSNIGITQISKLLSARELHDGLARFGLGYPSGIDLSRDLPGKIPSVQALANPVNHATSSYGYGLKATFMQLLKAYNVFNNDGILLTPRILDHLRSPFGQELDFRRRPTARRILRHDTVVKIRRILQEVVRRGTGVAAQYPGLTVGGKTGTAHIYQHGGYSKEYHSSFYGFVDDPKGHRYTIGVLVIKAHGYHKYFASQSAVPTFRKIVDVLVDQGYLKPNLTEAQRQEMLEKERKRHEAARRKQQERTRRIKEELRRQREQIRQKALERQRREAEKRRRLRRPVTTRPVRRYTPPPTPSRPKPPRRPTPREALPDMF
ncbi:penicillin-binding transpeptidase domain-containing protein [Nitratifractor sp.]